MIRRQHEKDRPAAIQKIILLKSIILEMIFDRKLIKVSLENALVEYDISGLSFAIDYEGQNIFSSGLGAADVTNTCEVKPDTIFGVASLTKILTTLILLKAEEKKLLKISDFLSIYYPNLRWLQNNNVSIRNLLNHSAGLPGLPTRHSATDLNYPGMNPEMESVASLVEYLNILDFELLAQPGQLLSYSNEGFCLLGGIIERVFNKPYELVAKELVFQPLKMECSFVGKNENAIFKNIAEPLVSWHQGMGPRRTQYWEAPLFYAAGGLMSSAKDMNILISALAGSSNFLNPHQYLQVHCDPMPVASRSNINCAYGLGIEIERINAQKTLLWHTGQRPGISSFVGHVIEKRLSVSLLTNITDAPTSIIGRLIFSHLLSKEINNKKLNWPHKNKEMKNDEDDFEHFVGIYGSPEVGEYKVYIKDQKLLLQFKNSKKEMIFNGLTSGVVGVQTFKFIFKNHTKSDAIALDLRILQRLE